MPVCIWRLATAHLAFGGRALLGSAHALRFLQQVNSETLRPSCRGVPSQGVLGPGKSAPVGLFHRGAPAASKDSDKPHACMTRVSQRGAGIEGHGGKVHLLGPGRKPSMRCEGMEKAALRGLAALPWRSGESPCSPLQPLVQTWVTTGAG